MEIGDILLVTGTGSASKVLVTAQKIRYSDVISSHVLFCLGDGAFIHANKGVGVELVFVLDQIAKVEPTWRALRCNGLSEEQRETLRESAMYYLKQDYNSKFFFWENDSSSFCSELVAKIYERAGITLFNDVAPNHVSPYHFDKEHDSPQMLCPVTDGFKQYLAEHEGSAELHRAEFNLLESYLFDVRDKDSIRNTVLDMARSLLTQEQKDDIDTVEKERYESRKVKFWDSRKPK